MHTLARELLLAAAIGIAVFGIDDLALDLAFFVRAVWRRVTVERRTVRAFAEDLTVAEPGCFAIIIPAWDESAVIGAMLRHLVTTIDHADYRVFVGIYPNDPATAAAVAAVADRRIVAVTTSRPGPTTKADCLNHLWSAVLAAEADGWPFKAVVLHDAEDVVHRLELRVFDVLIPGLAMVQLPVLPLVDSRSRWISGHYLDEFAEHHAKDIVVREWLGAAVPSAGVATAIGRKTMGRIAEAAGGEPFDADCLTEDYELGYRIRAQGGRAALVRVRSRLDGSLVATQEHFPATLNAAVRQKARWLHGIALGGWDRIGWPGGWADRYMLMRDRKGLAASALVVLAYVAIAAASLDATVRAGLTAARALPPLDAPPLGWLLWFNAALLGWRLAMRMLFTARAYGWREGVWSVPRAFVANLVNVLAAWRAVTGYRDVIRGRTQLRWDKTEHRFPVIAE